MNNPDKHITLKVENLSIGYKNRNQVLRVSDDISFELAKGELAAIIGINGIGKSTLLRTLGAVQQKISGNISIDQKHIETYGASELARKLSVVLTEPIISKHLTVRELISLGRQPYTNWLGTLGQEDEQQVAQAIGKVSLDIIANKKCYELSDGQLQKVMIARALAQDTALVFLDEPTTHLDLYHKAQILKLLRSIAHDTGKTILYTTHEIELAIQLCDKILILEKDSSHFGAPTELIEQKSFESLFPPESILFDPLTASFRIRN